MSGSRRSAATRSARQPLRCSHAYGTGPIPPPASPSDARTRTALARSSRPPAPPMLARVRHWPDPPARQPLRCLHAYGTGPILPPASPSDACTRTALARSSRPPAPSHARQHAKRNVRRALHRISSRARAAPQRQCVVLTCCPSCPARAEKRNKTARISRLGGLSRLRSGVGGRCCGGAKVTVIVPKSLTYNPANPHRLADDVAMITKLHEEDKASLAIIRLILVISVLLIFVIPVILTCYPHYPFIKLIILIMLRLGITSHGPLSRWDTCRM